MMQNRFTWIILLAFTISCQSETPADFAEHLDDLPVIEPQTILEVEEAGDTFFQHLNTSSVALSSGNVILNDRPQGVIIEISQEGELVRQIARQGRGPGEIQDASVLNADPDENLVIFDQRNQKIVQYFSDGTHPNEMQPFQPDLFRISSAFALHRDDLFLIIKWNPSALSDPDGELLNRFVIYDHTSDSTLAEATFPDQTFARQVFDGVVRGGVLVPYAPAFHYTVSNDNRSIFVSWSESNQIAELDLSLDTLRTIDLPLQQQRLTDAEADSLEQTYSGRSPNPWEVIEPLLPGYKASIDGLQTDYLGQIWVKLTRQSEAQEWLVLSDDGDPMKIVKLPKEGILTHISEHHLGFRVNDYTFSLLEAVR